MQVCAAALRSGARLEASLVLVGVGARPNTDLFAGQLDLLQVCAAAHHHPTLCCGPLPPPARPRIHPSMHSGHPLTSITHPPTQSPTHPITAGPSRWPQGQRLTADLQP